MTKEYTLNSNAPFCVEGAKDGTIGVKGKTSLCQANQEMLRAGLALCEHKYLELECQRFCHFTYFLAGDLPHSAKQMTYSC